MTYVPAKTAMEMVKGGTANLWMSKYGIFSVMSREAKPDSEYVPFCRADQPVSVDRLKELWAESGGKPKKFARLIEAEHGIQEWGVEER